MRSYGARRGQGGASLLAQPSYHDGHDPRARPCGRFRVRVDATPALLR